MIKRYSELANIFNNPSFNAWFGNSKVVDAQGRPKVVYHGAGRPDRIKDYFNPNRATSGPMAFFTDNPEIASGYAQGKKDTSLDHPEGYAGWFKYIVGRSEVPIDRAWYFLSPQEKNSVVNLLYTVGYENPEEGSGNIIPNSTSIFGKDSIDHHLQESGGNALHALVEIWLSSGALFNDERTFLDVLKATGINMSKVRYDDPNANYPAVYSVYLSIQNPLDTSNIPKIILEALHKKGMKQRSKPPKGGNPDFWDKNTISGKDWLQTLEEDIKNGTNYVWTRIPDWVTDVLKSFGYDGIKDVGGKYNPTRHEVWIPFYSTQIKSVFNKTFDPTKKKINSTVLMK
ncbi:MAG: hypothetical protein WC511_02330 [Candidatus Pacearchaeota archaeon]